jgi:uncharacterized protein
MKHVLYVLLIGVILLAACTQQASAPDVETAAPVETLVVVSTVESPTEPTATLTAEPAAEVIAPEAPPGVDELIEDAQEFITQWSEAEFDPAYARFDQAMMDAITKEQLKEIWAQLLLQVGAYQEQLSTRTLEQDGYLAVIVTTQFEKAPIDIRVVFDAAGQMAGLFFAAAAPPSSAYNPPGYVDTDAFQETEVTVGSGEWELPGTLTLPTGEGPFPAVVLVHGSGPNDRDETIGPNKPFRDLAWGLASNGIAVLRYDKRTLVYRDQFSGEDILGLTLKEETVDDALAAVQFLRQSDGIDPSRLFVLGHSQGAMAAPRIGQQDSGLAGLILLAGPSRPMEDLILEQLTYLSEVNGSTEVDKADLELRATEVARVKDPNLSPDTPASDLPLGIAPLYWLDLREYSQVEVAKSLAMPLFILQGGRDYQVLADKDYAGWQAGLEEKINATFKLYPSLNHLFIAGEGPSMPAEYEVEGHVSQEVIDDIAAWIMEQVPAQQ